MDWVLEDLVADLAEFKGVDDRAITEILENNDSIAGYFDDYFDSKYITEKNRALYPAWAKETEYYLYALVEWHLRTKVSRTNQGRIGIRDGNNLKCLDFGSGIGTLGLFHTLRGWNVTLCDINKPCLDFSKFRYEKHGLNAEFTDKINQVNYFDRILLIDTIGHLERPKKTLEILIIALKGTGIMEITWDLFETPARDHLWDTRKKEDIVNFISDNGLIKATRGDKLWKKDLMTENML